METATWHELNKLLRLALMGVGAAIAAVILSVLLGLGASSAHAADDDDGGLLGAVSGLVGDTTSLVGSTVTAVTSTATDAAAAAVHSVPAPVQPTVTAVSGTVTTVTDAVLAPVQRVVASEIVTTVAEPVGSLLGAVPVVGSAIGSLGVGSALGSLATDVDATLATLVGVVSNAGESLAPSVPITGTAAIDSESFLAPLRTGVTAAFVAATSVPTLFTADSAGAAAVSGLAALGAHALTSMGALCLSLFSAGPGGAGPGVWALAVLLPFVAHRAWVRRAGPKNELVPAAPAGSTDVSPD